MILPNEPFPSRPRAADSAPARAESLDAALVRRCQDGDEHAFAEIMARHREKIFAVTLRVIRNHADAEELTQDTFIRAHRALARFRGDSSLSTWLHRIALNLARNRYWYFFRRKRHATLSLECPLQAGAPATFTDLVATALPGPVRVVMTAEFTALIAGCLDRLAARPREILLLRTVRDLSYEEIAAELGIGLGTVKSRLARARESLRTLLADACPDFTPNTPVTSWFDPIRPGPGSLATVGA